MDKIEKEIQIAQLIKKYTSIFRKISKDKKPFVEKLYKQAAFMEITLAELTNTINNEGAVIESTNGNGFEVTTEHPAQKSYNTMIKNYNATIKTLHDMLPEQKNEKDELTEFLSRSNR